MGATGWKGGGQAKAHNATHAHLMSTEGCKCGRRVHALHGESGCASEWSVCVRLRAGRTIGSDIVCSALPRISGGFGGTCHRVLWSSGGVHRLCLPANCDSSRADDRKSDETLETVNCAMCKCLPRPSSSLPPGFKHSTPLAT